MSNPKHPLLKEIQSLLEEAKIEDAAHERLFAQGHSKAAWKRLDAANEKYAALGRLYSVLKDDHDAGLPYEFF